MNEMNTQINNLLWWDMGTELQKFEIEISVAYDLWWALQMLLCNQLESQLKIVLDE